MNYLRFHTSSSHLRLAILILALVLAIAGMRTAEAQSSLGETARLSTSSPRPATLRTFERGEELVLEAEFSRAVLRSIDVADFKFSSKRVGGASPSSKDELHLSGEIKSKGFFAKLFNLNFLEQVDSIVEPESFKLQSTKRYDQQGKRVRTSETVYDREAGKLTWTERDPRDESRPPRIVSAPLTDQVQDILSAIYFLRTQELTVGKTLHVSINDSGHVYQVPVRVVEKKRMKSVLGKVEAVRVDVDLFGARGMIAGEGEFSLWLTNDARRVPLKARIKHSHGTFDIKLKKIVQTPAHSAQSR